MTDISTVTKREKLKQRREPYWHKITSGRYLGFRRTADGGTWLAKFNPGDYGKRKTHALEGISTHSKFEQFNRATEAAAEWFKHVDAGGSTENISMTRACTLYVEHISGKKGAAAAKDAAQRLLRLVASDDSPLAGLRLTKLKKRHVEAWRRHIEQIHALKGRRGPGGSVKTSTRRSASTINRDMTVLRAVLNHAYAQGHVTSDDAWRHALKPIKNADGRRNVYLDRAQRTALINALPADAAVFARGLCMLPFRPGALAALTVNDFDARRKELVIAKDKSGAGRSVLLPAATVALLQQQAKDKLPAAHLFTRADGSKWDRDAWKKPIKQAVNAAKLPPETTAYTLRHSTISDLVSGGLDLFTVAQVSGTSVAMIEKHYGHLQKQRAADALATLAL